MLYGIVPFINAIRYCSVGYCTLPCNTVMLYGIIPYDTVMLHVLYRVLYRVYSVYSVYRVKARNHRYLYYLCFTNAPLSVCCLYCPLVTVTNTVRKHSRQQASRPSSSRQQH